MPLCSVLRKSIKQAPKVGCAYKGQVVEAIRVSHDLVATKGLEASIKVIDSLEKFIEAAVQASGTTTNPQADEIVRDFLETLQSYPECITRMNKANKKDSRNLTGEASLSERLNRVGHAVKECLPLQRRKHHFVLPWASTVISLEIPHNAKLPEILWKFRRMCTRNRNVQGCRNALTRNAHFYTMDLRTWEKKTGGIPPLSHRDAHEEDRKWTEKVLVYGDDSIGCIKLTSKDGITTKTYATVTRSAMRPGSTIFKDDKGLLFQEDNVRNIFQGGGDITWQEDNSCSQFVIDDDLKMLRDLIDRKRLQKLSSPSPAGQREDHLQFTANSNPGAAASQPNPDLAPTIPNPHYSMPQVTNDLNVHIIQPPLPNGSPPPSSGTIPLPAPNGQPKAGPNAIPALPGYNTTVPDPKLAPSQSPPSTPHNSSPPGRPAQCLPSPLPPKVQPEGNGMFGTIRRKVGAWLNR